MKIGIRHISLSAAVLLLLFPLTGAFAQSADQLQQSIDQHNQQINQLNQEISQYQVQLDATSQKKQTLQSQLNQLNLSIKKTNATISVTQNQIASTQLQIQQLGNGIVKAQATITDETQGLSESIRSLAAAERVPLSVQLLSSGNLAGAWDDIAATLALNDSINLQIQTLNATKKVLSDHKTAAEQKNVQLSQQKKTLVTQQGSLQATKQSQSDLLAQTKSQESAYQAIIAQKKAQEAAFEQDLLNLKSQYNQTVNPNQITQAAPGILQWPISGTIRITQYFGGTPFASLHSALYSGHGHDGLDIAAPIGTPVHAALSGVILATGNTDATKGCQGGSFGKWVMIQHNNGINTMYAHLSQITSTPGQQVSTGDVIGYSGETGYATGPHLHFGVYVSAVTKILPLGQATGGTAPCSKAIMPVPPVSGYLNPLNYLPSL
ncbi:MAG TPA: peptidoglycan DD-metalloendopeptidase family protein [Candidatus Paceibacterota bacterium]|nr:peptidoglycan DD-metalloendopeptidase family protein [Candidatus Paceibacterota bacterium]